MSGLNKSMKRRYYHKFVNMIRDAFDNIEERLFTDKPAPVHVTPMKQCFTKNLSLMEEDLDTHKNIDSQEMTSINTDISNKFRMALQLN